MYRTQEFAKNDLKLLKQTEVYTHKRAKIHRDKKKRKKNFRGKKKKDERKLSFERPRGERTGHEHFPVCLRN